MRFRTIFSTTPVNLLTLLNGGRQRFQEEFDRELYAIGAESVTKMRNEILTGGTTATRTAVRSARRVNAYGHTPVRREGTRASMDVGAIMPGPGGRVPLHVRVQEGFDAQGNRVDQFVIKPKKGPFLVFPIRQGGGLAKENIVGWVRTRGPVILRPRPALPTAAKYIQEEVPRRGLAVFRRTLFGRAAA